MIWRKKRESKDTEATSHPTLEGSAVRAGVAAGAQESEPAVSRGASEGSSSNIDRLPVNRVHEQLDFKPSSGVQTSQRRYAIPRSYRVWGRLVSARPVSIQGEMVDGEVVSQLVTVLPGGLVRAKTLANTVQVAGVVEGEVNAKLVDVASLGELRGSVAATELRVLPGAKLSGAELKIG